MNFKLSVITVILLLLIFGCRPNEPDSGAVDHSQYSVTDIAEAHAKFTIADLRADNRLSTNLETEKANAQKALQKILLEIDQLPKTNQENRYKILAEQLAYESRFADATDVSIRIQDQMLRDKLLEDIVRLQIQEIWQTYQKIARLTDTEKLPTEVFEQVKQAIKTAKQIDDPLCRARMFSSIALFRTKMNDRDGTVEMMNAAAEFCRNRKVSTIQKVRGLCLFANWFLREGNKEKTLDFCEEAENILPRPEQPFESLRLYLDISSLYILLGSEDSAKQCCDKAEKIVAQISEPNKQATALLKLAEAELVIRMKGEKVPLSERFKNIKNRVLEAVSIADILPDDNRPDADLPNSDKQIQPFSQKELIEFKNELLRKIASMQAWGASLEDAWETIEDIDSTSVRDEALSAAIEMMIVTHSTEDIKAWVEEIADPIKKKEILQKINP